MGKLVNYLKITFHISKIGLTLFVAYATFKWKVRGATGSFKKTLISEGLSEEVASTLAQSYKHANQKILQLVNTGSVLASKAQEQFDSEA